MNLMYTVYSIEARRKRNAAGITGRYRKPMNQLYETGKNTTKTTNTIQTSAGTPMVPKSGTTSHTSTCSITGMKSVKLMPFQEMLFQRGPRREETTHYGVHRGNSKTIKLKDGRHTQKGCTDPTT